MHLYTLYVCSVLIFNLIEVLSCGPHLLPGFIKQLDADTEELLPCPIMREEHGVIVIAALISCMKENIRLGVIPQFLPSFM